MPFKVGENVGEHAVVHDLHHQNDNPDPKSKLIPRDNFGYKQFDPEVGDTIGSFTVVAPDTEGAEEVWLHIDGSPEGTSNRAWLKSVGISKP